MAILEAACSGLHVVSTNVGGIPEVLPDDFDNVKMTLSEPTVEDLFNAVSQAISYSCSRSVSDSAFNCQRWQQHSFVKKLYTWQKIANKLETIYQNIHESKQ